MCNFELLMRDGKPSEKKKIIIIIIIITAIGLSPTGSGYFTCKQNIKLDTKLEIGYKI